jgi:hypothetical protein
VDVALDGAACWPGRTSDPAVATTVPQAGAAAAGRTTGKLLQSRPSPEAAAEVAATLHYDGFT